MSTIEEIIAKVYQGQGQQKDIGQAHLAILRGTFILPTEKSPGESRALFLSEGGENFLPVFSEHHYYQQWCRDIEQISEAIQVTGAELFKGIGPNVHLCLNIGSRHYKEFCPQEVARLKSIAIKLFPDSTN